MEAANPFDHILFDLTDTAAWKEPDELPAALSASLPGLREKFGPGPFPLVGVSKSPITRCVCDRHTTTYYEAGADHYRHPIHCYGGHPQSLKLLVREPDGVETITAFWFKKA